MKKVYVKHSSSKQIRLRMYEARVKLGLSVTAVSHLIGVTPTSYSRIENVGLNGKKENRFKIHQVLCPNNELTEEELFEIFDVIGNMYDMTKGYTKP